MSRKPGNVSLQDVRVRIDDIDRQILSLLSDRANCALQVATIKHAEAAAATEARAEQQGGVEQHAASPDNAAPQREANPVPAPTFYRPEREAQILRAVARRNDGPLHDVHVQRIFREIISASLSLEEQISVAYLGPQGTYSEEASFKHFGHSVKGMPRTGIAEIFAAVESGSARFGVVPVENSTEGTINHTLDLLMNTQLRICGEVFLRIQHQLLSTAESFEDIKFVHAHPQSLAQCRMWLDNNLPNAQRISESSNATAASIALTDRSIAAIASQAAAEHYSLNTLESGIEDIKTNTTRFLVIGDQDVPPSGEDATTLLISAPHKPGGLRSLLAPLEDAGISMTRIESRPGRTGLWEYVFFIDVKGHQADAKLSQVLKKLADEAMLMRVLGSYPSAL